MDDDIDYGALFGVDVPESGTDPSGEPDGQSPEGAGENSGPEVDVSNSDTPSQVPGDGQGAPQENVSESDTGQEPKGAVIRPAGEQPARQPAAAQAQPSVQSPSPVPDGTVAKARAEAQKAIDDAFARSGLKNPYTGQPITSKAEYDAYREKFDAERREQLLKKSGMSGEEFQQFVQDLPEVRRAREAQEAAEKAQREAREAAARVKVDEQIREIGAIDPSIKTLEDLTKMPTYPRFYELVQRGNTLTDAFRLANFDALTQRAAAGARQAAANAARSKEHLEQTRSRGTGAVSVPAEVREQYLFFNPGATEEEIQKHYQKNHKEG